MSSNLVTIKGIHQEKSMMTFKFSNKNLNLNRPLKGENAKIENLLWRPGSGQEIPKPCKQLETKRNSVPVPLDFH